MRLWFGLVVALFVSAGPPVAAAELTLKGSLVQGGLVEGWTAPDAEVRLDGKPIRVSPDGRFVFGFGRDHGANGLLEVRHSDGRTERRALSIAGRDYKIQRIDGLPKRMVTPPKDVLQRIRAENARIAAVRSLDTPGYRFAGGWIWPATGRVSGVYGSQRVLNGKPRRPHYGIDVAAPVGTPIVAPADGIVRMAEKDLYYTGGTIMLDHGHGIVSVFSHLRRVTVSVGQALVQGEVLGTLGATGRATGPHLDWRVNWFKERLDPGLLVGPMLTK